MRAKIRFADFTYQAACQIETLEIKGNFLYFINIFC